jgi:hypothetical protein
MLQQRLNLLEALCELFASKCMCSSRFMDSVIQSWRSQSQWTRACIAHHQQLLAKAWLSLHEYSASMILVKAHLAEQHRCKVSLSLAMLGWRAVVGARHHHNACVRMSRAHYHHGLCHRSWTAWRVRIPQSLNRFILLMCSWKPEVTRV